MKKSGKGKKMGSGGKPGLHLRGDAQSTGAVKKGEKRATGKHEGHGLKGMGGKKF